MKTYLRPDVESSLIALRRGNTDADLALLTRIAAAGGSPADMEAAIRASHAAETATSTVVPPPEIERADQRAAWITAAQAGATGAGAKFRSALPELYRENDEIAGAAGKQLPSLKERTAAALAARDAERVRQEQTLAGEEPSSSLLRRLRMFRRVEVGLALIAFALTTYSAAAFFGLVDGSAEVTASAIVQSVLVGLGGALSEWLLAYLIARIVERLNLAGNRRLIVAGAFATIIALVMYAGAVSALRFAGSQSDHLTATVDALGSGGMAIILSIASAGIGLGFVLLSLAMRALRDCLAVARQREALFATTLSRLERNLQEAEAALAESQMLARRTSVLDAHFESSLTVARREAAEREQRLEERLTRLRSAFGLLSRLAPGERENIVTKLFQITDKPAEAASAPRSPVSGAAVALLLACGLGSLGACANARANEILICDGTGAHGTEESCTTAWLHRSFDHWQRTARPGTTFLVIPTAGTLADTHVAVRLTVPAVRRERIAWVTTASSEIDTMMVPTDGDDPTINKSNLVAALAVAAREANNFPMTDATRLMIGSDAWLVMGRTVNFERRVPTAIEIAKLLGPAELPDLSRFHAIAWCGLGSTGGSAGQLAARDQFWGDFTSLLHGHLTRTLTSCALPTADALP